jgi:hypothetical protein
LVILIGDAAVALEPNVATGGASTKGDCGVGWRGNGYRGRTLLTGWGWWSFGEEGGNACPSRGLPPAKVATFGGEGEIVMKGELSGQGLGGGRASMVFIHRGYQRESIYRLSKVPIRNKAIITLTTDGTAMPTSLSVLAKEEDAKGKAHEAEEGKVGHYEGGKRIRGGGQRRSRKELGVGEEGGRG